MSNHDLSDKDLRRRRYEALLGIVDANTSPKQPPGVPGHLLFRMGSEHTYITPTQDERDDSRPTPEPEALVIKLRDHAINRGDLVQYTDPEGTVRYVRGDTESLREAIGKLNGYDPVPRDVIKELAGHIGGDL